MLEIAELDIGIEQVITARVQRKERHRPGETGHLLIQHKTRQLDRMHILQAVLQIGEKVLRYELHEHRIVAFEAGENISIRFDRDEPLRGDVSLTASTSPTHRN